MSDRKVFRQNQVTIAVRKERGMNRCGRVGSHLLYIHFIIQVVDLKLRPWKKDGLFRLIVLFHNLKLRFKLVIQQSPPGLRLIRFVFRNGYLEIVHRRVIVRCCCLPHDIRSVWQRDAAGIAFLIRKHFRLSIGSEYNRDSGSKIFHPDLLSDCFSGKRKILRRTISLHLYSHYSQP